ncbi:MAG TPA: hypothetical protein VG650_10725 [Mycobacteriales bacterium]|nr:hypothetical protein [Mycobacteriales bacterium]
MRRVIGIIAFAAGGVFTLQGVGVLKGSAMSNTMTWTILGPIIALVGAGIAYSAGRNRDKTDDGES